MRAKYVLLGDIRFQWKYGFYLIYTIISVIYVGILWALPLGIKGQVTAILIFSDPAALGLFFMGAMILLEKSQRVLNTVAVSPMRHQEYIWSKVLSLALISLLVAVVIALAVGRGSLPMILLGTLFSSVTFSLIGIIAATRIESLSQFMMISVGIEVFCFVPPILAVIQPKWTFLTLSPFAAAMRLIDGSSQYVLLDIGISLLLIALFYLVCKGQVGKMFGRVGGVKL